MARDKKGAMARARRDLGEIPEAWGALLSAQEWSQAVEVLGRERVEELHGLMTRVSPPFRSSFVEHLAGLGAFSPGQAVILALVRATDGARGRAAGAAALTGPSS